MEELLPKCWRYERTVPWPGSTRTALYGDRDRKHGGIDLVYLPPGLRRPKCIAGFR